MGTSDALLAHHTSLLGRSGTGFLFGGGGNGGIAYLVSSDDRNDFSPCSDELGIAKSAHWVRSG